MARFLKRKSEQSDVKVIINLISKKKPIILLIHWKQKEYIRNLFLNNEKIIELGNCLMINKDDISNIEFE